MTRRRTTGIAAAGVLSVLAAAWPGRARAVESADDVETDHVSAVDDGGPRTVGLVASGPALARGVLGAEVDVAWAEHWVLSIEGGTRPGYAFGGPPGYVASVGLLVFPQRFAFRGIYVHPFAQWQAWQGAAAERPSPFGGGATVGYAWTWAFGATVRLGAGIVYSRTGDGDDLTDVVAGLRPRVDASAGWVF